MQTADRLAPFKKPAFPGRTATVYHPYPAAFWHHHDCFDLSLLDGGAFFFSNDFLGSATGETYRHAWEDGSLLAPWRQGRAIDWDRLWQLLGSRPYPGRFEQHVWLNRLYCLLPLAQAWYRTGEKRYARGWDTLLTDWLKAHPPVAPLLPKEESKYCWYDMQVTTRLIMLIHSVFLLSHGDALTAASWRRVYTAIRHHAQHVHAEASHAHASGSAHGNHYQQKGAALIYAAVLFPEFPEATAWLAAGRAVLQEYAAKEILPDGANIEASPSYSHFIARLCLDPHLFLVVNGHDPLPGWEKLLQQQYAYLARTCDPTGHTLQISDSFRMDATADIDLVRALWPALKVTPRGKSRRFAASGLGVLRNNRFDVTIDATPSNLWHHHRGKPNVVLFRKGAPLLIDTGCPNYDEDVRDRWCKAAAAHNVVTIEEISPASSGYKAPVLPTCTCVRHSATEIEICHDYRTAQLCYTWVRLVSLTRDACRIQDRIEANVPVRATLHLHLPATNIGRDQQSRDMVVRMPDDDARLRLNQPTERFAITDRLAQGPDNHWARSAELTATETGTNIYFDLEIL